MNTVVISSKHPLSLQSIAERLSSKWPVGYSTESGYGPVVSVDATSSRVYIYPTDDPEFGGEYTLLMDYSDVELAKQVLAHFVDDPSLLIDNDRGTILPGDKFVARILSDPHWTWNYEIM